MMRKSLLILGLVATVGFLLAGLRGYQGGSDPAALQQHLYWALGSGLLLLLAHAAIALYLVATARLVARFARQRGLDGRYRAAAAAHVRRALPVIAAAVLLVALAVAAGGGLLARFTPRWAHHALVYVALAGQLLALRAEMILLPAQDRLIAELDREVGADAAVSA